MRWPASDSAPETIVRLGDEGAPGFAGLDASGRWYAVKNEDGVLTVRPVTGPVPATDFVGLDDPWGWPAFGEAVAVRVATAAWHDTDPSRLAWLTCPRARGGRGTLHTLDVNDVEVEPRRVHSLEGTCGERSGVRLESWGNWGFVLGRWDEERHELVFVDIDATAVVSVDTDSEETVIAAGSGGTVLVEGPPAPGASSSLLSVDGRHRGPVPGLADDEWVGEALWSPDGSRLALSLWQSATESPVIRIVDVSTGVEIAEIVEPGQHVWPLTWSVDGRFLFYERAGNSFDDLAAGDDDADWRDSWAVYDTDAHFAQSIPLPGGRFIAEIRSSKPALWAEQLTPVDWGIELDQADPGVHMVHMIVEARLLGSDRVDGVSGRLVWEETVVELCNIAVREEGPGFLHIGDIFGTDERCGSNPAAMQEAVDELGVPNTACVAVGVDGVDVEYCAPLR